MSERIVSTARRRAESRADISAREDWICCLNGFGPHGITKPKRWARPRPIPPQRHGVGTRCARWPSSRDGVRSHAGAIVEDTIDGCEIDASLARNVLESEGYIRFSLLHPVTLAEVL